MKKAPFQNKQVIPVVVLGWGSLIWDPRELKIDMEWQVEGPFLPIEFSRISNDGRLTLVRTREAKRVQVLWNTMSNDMDLNGSIKNLQEREGCSSEEPIGYIDLANSSSRSRDEVFGQVISQWGRVKGFNRIIWTDLGMNFKNKTSKIFTEESALEYLAQLDDNARAREYIEKAPVQIRTSLRAIIQKELNW